MRRWLAEKATRPESNEFFSILQIKNKAEIKRRRQTSCKDGRRMLRRTLHAAQLSLLPLLLTALACCDGGRWRLSESMMTSRVRLYAQMPKHAIAHIADLLDYLCLLGAEALSVACFSLWLVFMRQLAPNIDSLDGPALGPDGGQVPISNRKSRSECSRL